VADAVQELERRRDTILEQLDGWPLIKPAGGWSLLIDAEQMGMTASELSRALIEQAGIAATPMTGWGGDVADRHVRLVFSAEPVERLETIRERTAQISPRTARA
jgi:aspartate/methionine/tyrosine aminotransferase